VVLIFKKPVLVETLTQAQLKFVNTLGIKSDIFLPICIVIHFIIVLTFSISSINHITFQSSRRQANDNDEEVN